MFKNEKTVKKENNVVIAILFYIWYNEFTNLVGEIMNEKIKRLLFPIILTAVGFIFGILMICGVVKFNSDGMFESYAPYVIIFLSALNLMTILKELKK